ncbi:MAG TPA: DNA gyrase subunit A [Thermodesulfobacteriota bacterium]|nr:DNA gyrase subunit A [Thermodesulfobacteriota bacterium]
MPQSLSEIVVNIEDEMRKSYMDYAMSVIIGRALPDVRDGLKPVHRRVLYSMYESGLTWNKPYKKSARVVGDVLGKYHPHGDAAVYDTIVRMAQDFAMRYPLVDGQGNFGSIDGDAPAAMRYTEVRMSKLAGELLADIDKDTVDFGPNYDESETEPLVLPSRFPNLLVNGSSGIAVGMATNIPPHNLREVCQATIALIDDPEISVARLMRYLPGPDFPTGAFITGRQGIADAYKTGRGILTLRARVGIEKDRRGERESLVITEIPYQVNKAKLVEKIAELVNEKKIEGIAAIRDESDREGMRIVVELKRDAVAQVVLNQLYKHTPLQSTFGIIQLAIVHGQPQICTLKELLQHFVAHRREVVTRRTHHELKRAEARAHILEGYKLALDHLDEVIKLIRAAADRDAARAGLMARWGFTEAQATAILELRLNQLTGLERQKILDELKETRGTIARLKEILGSERLVLGIIKEELAAIAAEYGDERRTEIVDDAADLTIEDLIADEEMVVTVSHTGYIKRNPVSQYRSQRRGGRGVTGMTTKEEDFVVQLFVASTHQTVLFFTNTGRVYWLKVHEIPQASRAARGKAIVNLLSLKGEERVAAILPVRTFEEGRYIVFATAQGVVKRTELTHFAKPLAGGIRALTIDEGDQLIAARLTDGQREIMLATRHGLAIRFKEEQVRPMGRSARGVTGIELEEGDAVIAMEALAPAEQGTLLTICENGYGKRTPMDEYRVQNRGGKGIITIKTSDRNGPVVGVCQVTDADEVMLVTNRGKIIRCAVKDIRVQGRDTQGVRLISVEAGEKVVGYARLAEAEGDEEP